VHRPRNQTLIDSNNNVINKNTIKTIRIFIAFFLFKISTHYTKYCALLTAEIEYNLPTYIYIYTYHLYKSTKKLELNNNVFVMLNRLYIQIPVSL